MTGPNNADYHEPARSYRSLLPLAALFVALFLLDVSLGGAMAHAIGWLIALVLVVGTWALIVHAARVSHSLTVTADEVRVGEETIRRDEIVGGEPGIDEELPVLGWPVGRARPGPGLVVHRIDGTAVFVPSRFPDRLADTMGLTPAPSTVDVAIRAASPDDLPHIVEIDARADAVFRVAGYDLPDIGFDEDDLAHAKAIFVAGRPPVGYVWLAELDGLAYVEQLAVLPGSMRRGLGGALMEQAYAWARGQGYPAMILTTYADVPWNAPWYARRGWVEIDAVGPDVVAQRAKEVELGLDRTGPRVVMRREL